MMYVLEEYLAAIILAIVLAIVLGIVGIAILALVVGLHEEERFLDRALLTGSLALPHSWPRIWSAMRIAERWRALPVFFGRRTKLWWRRVYPRP